MSATPSPAIESPVPGSSGQPALPLLPEIRRAGAFTATVLGAYAIFVLFLWLPYGPRNGMPYETAFAVQSQSSSAIDGFLFGDPLRVYTNVFYHLGYLLSKVLLIPGSFVAYQLVYAMLWWGHGVVVYFTARRLWPQYPLFNFLLGSLLLFHSSDHALNWVGQMNQQGMIFWMLVSFYFLVVAFQARKWWGTAITIPFAGLFAYLSLWSYESQIFMISFVPIALLMVCGWRAKNIVGTLVYWIVPGVYAFLNYQRYAHEHGSYQQSVLRPDFTAGNFIKDLIFNMYSSLEFWTWPMSNAHYSVRAAAMLGIGAAAAMALFMVVLYRFLDDSTELVPRPRLATSILVSGVALLALSFPAYLILTSSRWLWRTQFLSGLGAVLAVGGLVALAGVARKRLVPLGAMLCVGCLWAYFGTVAAYDMAAFHYRVWEGHRRVIAGILHAVPSAKDNTVFVLTNVPKAHGDVRDPFGDIMWFDMAIRLAYPDKSMDAIYFYADSQPCPSFDFTIDKGQWTWHSKGYPPMLGQVPFANTVILRLEGDNVRIVRSVPSYISTDPAILALYHPGWRILKEPPAQMAVNRYFKHGDIVHKDDHSSPREAVPAAVTATHG